MNIKIQDQWSDFGDKRVSLNSSVAHLSIVWSFQLPVTDVLVILERFIWWFISSTNLIYVVIDRYAFHLEHYQSLLDFF